ncbi:hypothetical protein KY285_036306 [Solanum tuberosum]|nr:hypothetical protein KY285_036306 [Solanum tuberosum]
MQRRPTQIDLYFLDPEQHSINVLVAEQQSSSWGLWCMPIAQCSLLVRKFVAPRMALLLHHLELNSAMDDT